VAVQLLQISFREKQRELLALPVMVGLIVGRGMVDAIFKSAAAIPGSHLYLRCQVF
jgi:hypothetical protein